jgi:hypothetical protein
LTLLLQKPNTARSYDEANFNCFELHTLEDEFQSELNQPRICPRCRAGHDAEVLIVGGTANGVGRRELGPIKDVEELRAKLEIEPIVGAKSCSLE